MGPALAGFVAGHLILYVAALISTVGIRHAPGVMHGAWFLFLLAAVCWWSVPPLARVWLARARWLSDRKEPGRPRIAFPVWLLLSIPIYIVFLSLAIGEPPSITLIAVPALLIGPVIAAVALRRRVGLDPACAHCGYALSVPSPFAACPECGRCLAQPLPIVLGRDRVDPVWLVVGLALIAAGYAGLTLDG